MTLKTCPVCDNKQNQFIEKCEECGWDFPVIVGDGEHAQQIYQQRLSDAKTKFEQQKSLNDKVTQTPRKAQWQISCPIDGDDIFGTSFLTIVLSGIVMGVMMMVTIIQAFYFKIFEPHNSFLNLTGLDQLSCQCLC